MRFGVLGPLAVWDDRGTVVRVPELKVRALLADLLVHEGRPVPADRLIDDLWGARPPGRAANALQAKVSQLRRVVGRDLVVHQPAGYSLRVEDGDVDAGRFRALLARVPAAGGPRARAALLTEALRLWRGPAAYADLADEEFVRTAAGQLAEQRLAALEEQAELRLELGGHGPLVAELGALVEQHPLRERLRAVQLRALYRAGRQGEALAAYRDLRDRLAEELGLDPGPGLVALHRSILTRAPELDATEPAGAASGAEPGAGPRTNLPAPLTELVGREESVAAAASLLGAGRLVTLTGPGGVGKTRLAIETAARVADAFPDGVWIVEPTGRQAAETGAGSAELAETIATTLGLRDDTAAGFPGPSVVRAAPADRLAAALRDRTVLLVLDNCEPAIEAVAELADVLLRSAPGLRVLATSQEPLGLAGEVLRSVEPLRPTEAVRLFTARAAAAAPGFVLDTANTAAVEVICRRLDGIPLALELAATRVRALGVHQLADRLDDRFRVLTGGHRGAPARQRTLRAVIEWSWELLTAPERVVLRRLAAHTDGCTLQAAEAVCPGDGVRAEDVLDLLVRLVGRSLVVMTPEPEPAGPRYRLLESIAAYGTERLHETADLDSVRDRHLAYYTDLAERAGPHLRGPQQGRWLRRLDAETGNLRAALATALRRRTADEALRLTSALSWYWLLRGRLGEARRSLHAALAAGEHGSGPAALRAEVGALHAGFALLTGERTPLPGYEGITDPGRRAAAQWFHAHALFNAGDLAASEDLTDRALAGFRAHQDRWGIAAALGLRATHRLIRGDMAAVRRDGERSAELFAELGDRWGRLRGVSPLAARAEVHGDYATAARLLEDGLRMAEELGLAAEVSYQLSGLGRIALLTGDTDRARELHERARRLAVASGFKFGEIHASMGLALGARRQGELATAEALFRRIREWYATVSSEAGNAFVLAELGFVAELRGDAAAARTLHAEGLAVARLVGDPRAVALALEGLAGAEALSGRADHAAALLGAADAARRAAGAPLPAAERGDVDRVTRSAQAVLGAEAFTGAFRRGAALGADAWADPLPEEGGGPAAGIVPDPGAVPVPAALRSSRPSRPV
ncbi:BTAD domain-containing putative transcriptional regulator [Streptomyces sp. NPDC006733]|uniref:BTAD domain-containing putative transcriptional regulator n=1 Tax=Streptomyces sp. NPDC006733 TaxID=3155460 RepID=UPI0033F7B205